MWVASNKLMYIANLQARVMKPIGTGAMLRIGHASQLWYLSSSVACFEIRIICYFKISKYFDALF